MIFIEFYDGLFYVGFTIFMCTLILYSSLVYIAFYEKIMPFLSDIFTQKRHYFFIPLQVTLTSSKSGSFAVFPHPSGFTSETRKPVGPTPERSSVIGLPSHSFQRMMEQRVHLRFTYT